MVAPNPARCLDNKDPIRDRSALSWCYLVFSAFLHLGAADTLSTFGYVLGQWEILTCCAASLGTNPRISETLNQTIASMNSPVLQ